MLSAMGIIPVMAGLYDVLPATNAHAKSAG
jgi:hypothetical protein